MDLTVPIQKVKYIWNATNRWHKVSLIFILIECGVIPIYEQGFNCDDPSLSYKYTGDTISWKWLLTGVAILPLGIMLLVEKYLNTKNFNIHVTKWNGEYLFGLLVHLTVIEFLKLYVGKLRPHFFDTCRPIEAKDCTGDEYIPTYTCSRSYWTHSSNQSFPSGHASMGFHAAVFLICYLQSRIKKETRTMSHLSQLVLLMSGSFCAWSRVMDHRHFVVDVVVGSIIGIATGCFVAFYLCKNFKIGGKKKHSSSNSEN